MNTQTLVIITVILAGAIIALVGTLAVRRRRRDHLGVREPLTGSVFFERFYRDSGLSEEVVVEVRDEVASALDRPAALLRPTDRLDHEFQPAAGWEGFDEDPRALRSTRFRIARRHGKDLDWSRIHALDDIIRQVGGTI